MAVFTHPISFVKEAAPFLHLCWKMGWKEANGGNLSWRLPTDEVKCILGRECREREPELARALLRALGVETAPREEPERIATASSELPETEQEAMRVLVVEDGRVDAFLRRGYPGLDADMGPFIEDILSKRPDLGGLTLGASLMEMLVRISLDPAPSTDDFLQARLVYQEDEGLDSRVVRRYDHHYDRPDAGGCEDDGIPEDHPDYCVGPAKLQPLILQALNAGIEGTGPRAQAARRRRRRIVMAIGSVGPEHRAPPSASRAVRRPRPLAAKL